jgi:uroporphyrinogen-III synthase
MPNQTPKRKALNEITNHRFKKRNLEYQLDDESEISILNTALNHSNISVEIVESDSIEIIENGSNNSLQNTSDILNTGLADLNYSVEEVEVYEQKPKNNRIKVNHRKKTTCKKKIQEKTVKYLRFLNLKNKKI